MKVAIIAASGRSNSESARVARFLAARLEGRAEAWVHDLGAEPLPMWEPGMVDQPEWLRVWQPLAQELRASDALVLVAPEWNGMAPPAAKNLLMACGHAEVAHKPGLIVGVSAGVSGTWPVAELRLTGAKNNRLCWIPDHLVLRGVGNLFVGDTPASPIDEQLRARVDSTLGLLLAYADALRAVRASGAADLARFPNGM
jgi:NAD(P)H-dependent FMN reductase